MDYAVQDIEVSKNLARCRLKQTRELQKLDFTLFPKPNTILCVIIPIDFMHACIFELITGLNSQATCNSQRPFCNNNKSP